VQAILGTVERFRSLGYRETRHGVRLFGPVPHVAPQAWCHAIHRGLTNQEIAELSRGIDVVLPAEYTEFLHEMNGAHLFAGALALYCVRPFAGRDVDSAFLPFDIVDANGHERPRGLRGALFIIGGYRFDGSRVAMDASTGRIERIDRDSGSHLNEWRSLRAFLASEMQRLDAIHDSEGRLIMARESLVPGARH
jgi:hypothetical protein